MRLHPFFTLVWAAIFAFPAIGFAMEDMGLTQSVASSPQGESQIGHKMLQMTDQEVNAQCASGAHTLDSEACKTALNYMRGRVSEAHESNFSLSQLEDVSPQGPADTQSGLMSQAAQKAETAKQENIKKAKFHGQSVEELKGYRDQMNRNQHRLLAEQQELARMDPDIKARQSVVTSEGPAYSSSRAPTPEPSYDDYKVGRPISYQPPSKVIDASTTGSRNLAEYEKQLPARIQRQERVLKLMDEFEKDSRVKKTRSEFNAVEFGKQATSLFLQAKNLGATEESLYMPVKHGPKPAERIQAKQAAVEKPESAAAKGEAGSALGYALNEAGRDKPAQLAGGSKEEESSEEAAVLGAFQPRLHEDGKGKLSPPERMKLRDLLRQRALARKRGESFAAGELIAELLKRADEEDAEQALAGREPASLLAKPNDRRGVVRLDVQGAMAEIESQIEEINRSMGILSAESESLFERVSGVHRRSEKSGVVGKGKS